MLSNLIDVMSLIEPVAISIETLMIDNECYFWKYFIEFISMDPRMVLYLTINQVN